MRIGCTKKLIDYLGCKVEEIAPDVNSLFCFTANLVTINRKKCIVVTNDGNRMGFVLYGITAKDKKNIHRLFIEGLRTMLGSENYSDELIEKYLTDCADVVFTKTADRKATAKNNKFLERVMYLSTFIYGDDMFQREFLPFVNDDIATIDGDCVFTKEVIVEQLESYYSIKARKYSAFTIDVALQLENEDAVRRVTVPCNITLFQLHLIIQTLFEWEESHMHGFVLKTGKNGEILEYATMNPEEEADALPGQTKIIDESEYLLSQCFLGKKSFVYEYDFGDSWIHEIRFVELIEDCDLEYPVCTSVQGTAPPEDCGGPLGFERLKEAIADKDHPDHEELLDWLGYDEFKEPDIREINWHLKYTLRDTVKHKCFCEQY